MMQLTLSRRSKHQRRLCLVKLHYLYKKGERCEVSPRSDAPKRSTITYEQTKSSEFSGDVHGGFPTAISAGVQVRFLKGGTLRVEEESELWSCTQAPAACKIFITLSWVYFSEYGLITLRAAE
jgi:hypothetical protein